METNLVAVQLELTNACKLACAECPRILMSRPVGVMRPDLAKMIIREALAMNPSSGFNVNGLGEPLMYPHFGEVIQYMDEQKATKVDLFTSLVAGEKQFDSAMNALHDARLHVQIVITKHLYDNHGQKQIEDQEFDSRMLRILSLQSRTDVHIGVVLTKFHTKNDIEEFAKRYKKLVGANNFHVIRNLNPWFNLVKDMASAEYGADPDNISKNICDYPFILLHVGWNGDVIICCTDDVDGECVLGTIREPGDVSKVWNNEKFKEIRQKHNDYIIDMAPCTKCSRTAWARLPIPKPAL